MASNETALGDRTGSGRMSEETARSLLNVVELLRSFVEKCGRWTSWLFVPLVLITVFDVCLRKTGKFQIEIKEFMEPYYLGWMFESTLLQEFEWHTHTALFAMVLGYGYVANTHVRVDLVRETMAFRKKVWMELIGCTIFLIPFTSIVIYFAAIYAYDSFMIGEISASMVGLPHRWVIKSILTLGLCVALIAGVTVWLQSLVTLMAPPEMRFPLMTLEWPEQAGDSFEGKERMKVDLEKTVDEDLNEMTNKILSREDQNKKLYE